MSRLSKNTVRTLLLLMSFIGCQQVPTAKKPLRVPVEDPPRGASDTGSGDNVGASDARSGNVTDSGNAITGDCAKFNFPVGSAQGKLWVDFQDTTAHPCISLKAESRGALLATTGRGIDVSGGRYTWSFEVSVTSGSSVALTFYRGVYNADDDCRVYSNKPAGVAVNSPACVKLTP